MLIDPLSGFGLQTNPVSRLVFQNVQLLTSSDVVLVRSLSPIVGMADAMFSRVLPRFSTSRFDSGEGSIKPRRKATTKT
jgi:hypothetical protein